jgi:hypothetical protein
MVRKIFVSGVLLAVLGLMLGVNSKPTNAVAMNQAEMRQVSGGNLVSCYKPGKGECKDPLVNCGSTKCTLEKNPLFPNGGLTLPRCPVGTKKFTAVANTYDLAVKTEAGETGRTKTKNTTHFVCVNSQACSHAGEAGAGVGCEKFTDGNYYCIDGVIGPIEASSSVIQTKPDVDDGEVCPKPMLE